MDSPIEEGFSARMKFRDGALWRSLLVFLVLEDPPAAPLLLTDPGDLELKIDEPKEVSGAPNDAGTLCDVSCRYPTAASWWGGGNFSLLLLAFVCVTVLHLWISVNKHGLRKNQSKISNGHHNWCYNRVLHLYVNTCLHVCVRMIRWNITPKK